MVTLDCSNRCIPLLIAKLVIIFYNSAIVLYYFLSRIKTLKNVVKYACQK